MNSRKIIGKSAFFFTVAAMGALTSGSAGALESAIITSAPSYHLVGSNLTNGCVRFYVNGQHDVPAHHGFKLGTVQDNGKLLQASVFAGACGGKAIKTVSFKPSATDSRTIARSSTTVDLYWSVNN
ncbi:MULTISPECIES: signal peptidase [unclassified Duganella]|uniref:signal peptidase n=1 Tax=unclassified Duganella TaxID=2636909 RepID=UPI001E360E14|nr:MULTISPECIES: signal peptidase [unclassified Duganella]